MILSRTLTSVCASGIIVAVLLIFTLSIPADLRGVGGRGKPRCAQSRCPDDRVSIQHSLKFIREYVSHPTTVGAVAPSSPALARALCEPFRRFRRPARVLEVGAGTGAVTRYLGQILGPEDELDICELQPRLADVLRRDVLRQPQFDKPVKEGRVRLLVMPVQDIGVKNHYDFIISGLPLTVFGLEDVQDVFSSFRKYLKRNGVLSYFEYVAMRRTSRTLALGKSRRRIRSVSRFLSDRIKDHQFARHTVLRNFPPAYARHLQFRDIPAAASVANEVPFQPKESEMPRSSATRSS